jgi:hypothetical protein
MQNPYIKYHFPKVFGKTRYLFCMDISVVIITSMEDRFAKMQAIGVHEK